MSQPAFLPKAKAFADKKQFVRFFTKEFVEIVRNNNLIEIRNALAHGENEKLNFKNACVVRNLILGIGTPGLISNCYKYFYKDKFESLYTIDLNEDSSKTDNKKAKSGLKLVG